MRDSIKSIQFLRFFAASLVVYSHSMEAIDIYIKDSVSRSLLYLTDFGASGVHIFFVISGFIMVYTSFRRGGAENFDASTFILRRFIRIYPIYWVCAAAYIVLYQIIWEVRLGSAYDIIGSLLLVPGYSSFIIGPGWTLAYEVYFYICFAIFMTLGLLRGLLTMTLFFLLSIAVGAQFTFQSAIPNVITNSLLLEFLAGAWIAYFFVWGVHLSTTLSRTFVVLAVGLFIGSLAFGYRRIPTVLTWGIPSAFLIAGLVFIERRGALPAFIERCAFLGNSSYSLYLLHVLLIDLFLGFTLWMFPNLRFGYLEICIVFTVLSIATAHVFHELIERRLLTSLQAVAKGISRPKMAQP
jgi:exopolysaccharide production protein ExoZ